MGKLFCGLFELVFPLIWPDDCRICGVPLREVSRIPVCPACLNEPQPLIAEYYCATCRTPFVSPWPLDESGQCALCRQGLTGFDAVYSYGSYEGALRKLIHLFKFDKVQPLAKPLGRLMAQAIPLERQFDLIVPMPLHWRRRWSRGFNQSRLLAQEISKRWHVPVRSAVRRVKLTPSQAGLTNAKRRANVRGAFRVTNKETLRGARVLLIDDVLTTGATASACARALKRAGAASVALAAVARADRRATIEDFRQFSEARDSKVATAVAGGKLS